MTRLAEDSPSPEKLLESFATRVVESTGIPALSLGMCLDGKSSFVCVGRLSTLDPAPITPHARFCIGSIAKVLVNIVALELAAIGKLDLEAPICTYLPELAVTDKARQIQVRHLLSHTSGYQPPDLRGGPRGSTRDWGEFVTLFSSVPLLFRPGTVFNYNRFDHVILDRILARLEARTTLELAREMIFEPLRLEFDPMQRAHDGDVRVTGHLWDATSGKFQPQEPADIHPISSLSEVTLSVSDLTRFTAAHIGSPENDLPGLPSLPLVLTQVAELPRCAQPLWQQQMPSSYGYGFARYQDGSFGHPGSASGQCCVLRFDPSRRIAIALALNARARNVRDGIVDSVLRLLRRDSARPPTVAPLSDMTFRLHELPGCYIGPKSGPDVSVRAQADSLVLSVSNGRAGARVEREFFLDPQQRVVPRQSDRTPLIPVCFFREPGTGTPCLMFGWRAYKRSAAEN